MGKQVNIQLPKALLAFPEADRAEVLRIVQEALALPETRVLPRNQASEHNMWERNDDHLLADAEDELYLLCAEAEAKVYAELMHLLDLPNVPDEDVRKSFSDDFYAWEADHLEKAKGKRGKISDLVQQQREKLGRMVNRTKEKRKQFTDWVGRTGTLTKKQLDAIDKVLRSALPDVAKQAEALAIRASFIGKIRGQAEQDNFETFGAFIDRIPQALDLAKKEGVVLTLREKEKAGKRKVEILPLTPQEAESAEVATVSAGNKITEISEKHRANVRQVIVQATRERWTSEVLARKLLDQFGEHNRDWRRVAITELSFAVNDAYLNGVEEGERVIGMGSVSACKHCKQYVIGKEFIVTHKVPTHETYETDMKYVWAGKSNYGRRLQEYRPCIPLHPNCRCRWHRISRFYQVDKEGNLQRKTTAELIQEERAKRGLPPDPDIEQKLADIRAQLAQL